MQLFVVQYSMCHFSLSLHRIGFESVLQVPRQAVPFSELQCSVFTLHDGGANSRRHLDARGAELVAHLLLQTPAALDVPHHAAHVLELPFLAVAQLLGLQAPGLRRTEGSGTACSARAVRIWGSQVFRLEASLRTKKS